ncbi:MAG: glycosyltransferase, partial [Cyanobacteria bacterium P01_C01_bin.73]
MHTPIVSIVIPVFNGQDTIERTVSSVLSQTFSDFELI